jgi:hypothetical protein
MRDTIDMAREAGWWTLSCILRVRLKRFEALVRADERSVEREACAKAADDQWVRNPNVSGGDAIRERSSSHSDSANAGARGNT